MPESLLHSAVLRWYADHGRVLPWRQPAVGSWAVLVSEVMLQQTPVTRVLPAYEAWMRRWPTPAALAAERPGEAVRMWGRLGYPRRALRLHAAATVIDERHNGSVPTTYEGLRGLPGVGDYTAAAVTAFAFRRRSVVLDTNVRRVLTRSLGGSELAAANITAAERELAESVLPAEDHMAAAWSVALMELGALLCRPMAPRCGGCPLRDACAWRAAGYPPHDGPERRAQTYAGTDRQCRGRILSLLRDSDEPILTTATAAAWDDDEQRARALASLLEDGLAVIRGDGRLSLP